MLKRLNRAMLQTSTVAYTAAAGATLPDSGRIAEKLDALEPQPKACERCDRWLDSVDLLCSLQLAALCASMPVPCPISGCPANCTAMCWELSTLWHYGTFEAYSTVMNACSTAGYWPQGDAHPSMRPTDCSRSSREKTGHVLQNPGRRCWLMSLCVALPLGKYWYCQFHNPCCGNRRDRLCQVLSACQSGTQWHLASSLLSSDVLDDSRLVFMVHGLRVHCVPVAVLR